MKIEKSHRFLGVGEGDNEMPEHLLEELRKRTIYYKSEIPKDIQVRSKIIISISLFIIL